ncbi:phosphotransferase family protein [Streptomyces canus]|uniref:phosphotransferase family protein n=1 Tax=Streptomyces canus TaxID=58343 RepID=UPI00371E2A63
MSPHLQSEARRLANELSSASETVRGPLRGYHHETYVMPLPLDGRRSVKFREPRSEILWFDRRCFSSEEELLVALQGWISCVPDVLDVGGVRFQRFIEGRTIRRGHLVGRRVPDAVFGQIVDLFRQLVRIDPHHLGVERRCEREDRAQEGDCYRFLDRLITFSEKQVFERNRARFGELFSELGVGQDSFSRLRKHASGLRERPFCLLHADLHRENFIIDGDGRLWAIDWELAMTGDPLYDLATHLYLMRYPEDQSRRMTQEWCEVVERVRPGSSYGWECDLPLILDFKRAQSVFTDVIRTALSLQLETGFNWPALPGAAGKLWGVLAAAAEPLGLDTVPGPSRIMRALERWQRETRRAYAPVYV